jgi:NitT/TauT family transport system ATP-binding protein
MAVTLDLHVARKSFATRDGELSILADVSLSLGAGEIVAISGPSGCGKTTLLRIIGGLDRAFTGRLSWAGPEPPLIGTVFQQPLLLPWRTVRENMLIAGAPADGRAVHKMLAQLGLDGFEDAWPGALSLGMQRRAALARALCIAPDVLLLDEPFASLDPVARARCREVLLADWRERHCIILFVTHAQDDANALADRMLRLGGTPARIVEARAIVRPISASAGRR